MRRIAVITGLSGVTGFSIGTRWLSIRGESLLEWAMAASDSTILAILFAFLAEHGALLYTVSLLAQLVLYAIGIYLLWPALLPGRGHELVRSHRVRISLTGTVLLIFSYIISRGQSLGQNIDLMAAIVLVLLVPCVIGWLLVQSHPTPYDPEEGCIVYVCALAGFGRPETRSALTEEFDPSSRGSIIVYTYLAGLVLTALALFAGMLLSLFFILYPLLEITVLVFGVLSIVISRLSVSVWTVNADVEAAFLTTTPTLIGTPKGLATFVFIFSGLAMAGIPLFAVIGVLTLGGRELLIEMATGTRGATVAVGLICGVVYGIYGVWYWLMVTRRLPTLLRVSRGVSVSPVTTRPHGAMFFPTVLLLYPASVSIIQALVMFYGPYDEIAPLWLVGAIGVGFIVVLTLVTWNVLSTFHQVKPQPAASDDWAIPTAIVVQSIGFVASLVLLSLYDPVAEGGIEAGVEALRSSVPELGRWLLLLPPFLALFHADRLGRKLFGSDSEKIQNLIMIAVLVILSGFVVIGF